ncbi:MAG TPA: ABC transporter substrate-binding protein [Desulfobaccales bacterium]|nr:ABC transporter substrate-binding protein [Desulfobaccales bacterium]
MAIQNNPNLDHQVRAREIHQIIATNFDFASMARDSLGPTYDRLSPGERQQFMQTFSYLFQDSYTRLVINFLKNENIKYGRASQENNHAKVDTTIVRTNESIPVTYMMHRASGGWILHDVIVDGVSILANYKSQFARVIETKSFRYLLDKMEEQRRAIQ